MIALGGVECFIFKKYLDFMIDSHFLKLLLQFLTSSSKLKIIIFFDFFKIINFLKGLGWIKNNYSNNFS